MLFAVGGLAFITFLTIAFVGVADARAKLRRFENEIDRIFPAAEQTGAAGDPLNTGTTLPDGLDRVEHNPSEIAFTSSLLAAMDPHSQAKPVCPEAVSEEEQSSAERARIG